MFKIFNGKKKETQYISVMFDETETGSRIALLAEVRGRIAAMPNECGRDIVLKKIDDELTSLVDRYGSVEYASVDKTAYSKMIVTSVKKKFGI